MILGVARLLRARGRHVVTSAVEHPAVLEPCAVLAAEGFRVTRVPVDGAGRVDPARRGRRRSPRRRSSSPSCTPTTRWGRSSPSPRSPASPASGASSSTPTPRSRSGKVPVDVGRARRRLPDPGRPQALRAEGRRARSTSAPASSCPASCTGPPTSRDAAPAPRTCSRSWASARRARSRARDLEANAPPLRGDARPALGGALAGGRRTCGGTATRGGPAEHAQRRLRRASRRARSSPRSGTGSPPPPAPPATRPASSSRPSSRRCGVPMRYAMGTVRFSVGRGTTAGEVDEAVADRGGGGPAAPAGPRPRSAVRGRRARRSG